MIYLKIEINDNYYFEKENFVLARLNNNIIINDFNTFIKCNFDDVIYIENNFLIKTKIYKRKFYLYNTFVHRLDGPAIIEYEDDIETKCEYYIFNKHYNIENWLNNIIVKRYMKLNNILNVK